CGAQAPVSRPPRCRPQRPAAAGRETRVGRGDARHRRRARSWGPDAVDRLLDQMEGGLRTRHYCRRSKLRFHHARVTSTPYGFGQSSVAEVLVTAKTMTALVSGILVALPMMATAEAAAPANQEKDQVLAVMHAVVDAWNKAPAPHTTHFDPGLTIV